MGRNKKKDGGEITKERMMVKGRKGEGNGDSEMMMMKRKERKYNSEDDSEEKQKVVEERLRKRGGGEERGKEEKMVMTTYTVDGIVKNNVNNSKWRTAREEID